MTSRAASLLIGLWFLAIATSASAECAWVLWTQNVIPASDEKWSVSSAHATQERCDAALKEEVASARKLNRTSGTTDHVLLLNADGTPFAGWRYYCLPDTVDPRGPKGTK
jgi:hypothetical protein